MSTKSLIVIVVEDNDRDFELLATILRLSRDWDAEIVRFREAEEALRELPRTPADLIFLDFRLAGTLTGRELLQRLRQSGDERPVIALTGQGDEKTATDFMREGASDYLSKKDITPERVRHSVANVLREARLRREKLVLEAELHDAQKMEGVVTLAGGIAHDFNNMLMSITGNIQLALLKTTEPEVAARLEKTQLICDQMGETVRKLQSLRPGGFHQLQEIDLERVVGDALVLLRGQAGDRVSWNVEMRDTPLQIEGSDAGLRQILEMLALNSVEAMPGGGEIGVRCYRLNARDAPLLPIPPGGEYVVLEFADTGRGIDARVLKRIFEPFFSTKEPGVRKGTGLSLAVVWQLVHEYNGSIEVDSRPGKGTTFRLFFPSAGPKAARRSDAAEAPGFPSGGETILLADDEEMVLEATTAMLEHLGYRVIRARDGLEALSIFRRRSDQIDAVLLDISMPQMDGIRCFQSIREINAAIPVLFFTAHGADHYAARLEAEGAAAVLDKPIEMMLLAGRLRGAISRA